MFPTARTAIRTRWAALGAAVAVTLGAGGVGLVHATTSSGERAIYTPINPCRLADLRPAPDTVGPRSTPLDADEIYTLSGWGTVGGCELLSGTSGLALNVTAANPTQPTFLRLWPTGGDEPSTSNLNPSPGQPPTPNSVNVGLSSTGQFNVYNRFGSVNVIIDVVGVYNDHNHDDRYYTKTQVDALGASKADVGSVFSRTQSDARYYTQAQVDALGASKADVGSVFSRTQSDSRYYERNDVDDAVDAAKPTAVFEAQDGAIDVEPTDTVVLSAPISVDGPGDLMATAGVTFDDSTPPVAESVSCSLALGAPVFDPLIARSSSPPDFVVNQQIFEVGAGSHTVHYVCRVAAGTDGVSASEAQLTLLALPD